MTVHILVETNGTIEHQLVEITKHDAVLIDAQEKFNVVDLSTKTLGEKIKLLAEINYEPGDVVCFAGLCLRQFTKTARDLAKLKKINLIPGTGVDHRLQTIWPNKISRRLPIDKNFYAVWPSLLIIGDVETAQQGFSVIGQLIADNTQACWPHYVPEDPTLEQTLSILSIMENWQAPDWFKLVDLSIRDLEVVPVMYATHAWHDWIAFYPANGNFKLENHTQLYPVWLAGSLKPLEYWKV
jgi:hypothetical protein